MRAASMCISCLLSKQEKLIRQFPDEDRKSDYMRQPPPLQKRSINCTGFSGARRKIFPDRKKYIMNFFSVWRTRSNQRSKTPAIR